MSEIKEVQEQMKADKKAMKDQMTSMIKVMLSMRRMMEDNVATFATSSTGAKADPTHPSGLKNPPVSDMVGQGGEALGSTGGPHFVQVQNKHSFPPYGLPPNYTPLDVTHAPNENFDNSAPTPIESQQPQSDHAHVSEPMGETHEAPRDHNLVNFKPHLGCAIEGQAFGGIPLPNTLGGPQYRP
ncbi:hypothetical protein GmHk_20G057744 [Glycine max]|nr:hypothetical protein GmHk_20G057744 [Glycine max]